MASSAFFRGIHDREPRGLRGGKKFPITRYENDLVLLGKRIANGHRRGEMNRVGASKAVEHGECPGATFQKLKSVLVWSLQLVR